MSYLRQKQELILAVSSALVLIVSSSSFAETDDEPTSLKFTDVAVDPAYGITHQRVKSPRDSIMDELRSGDPVPFFELLNAPLKPHGEPGVIIFDADMDGDEDIYATNGPGMANSLYINQLVETNSLSFIDKGSIIEFQVQSSKFYINYNSSIASGHVVAQHLEDVVQLLSVVAAI